MLHSLAGLPSPVEVLNMRRHRFLTLIALNIMITQSTLTAASPNVLIFLTDDQGWDDVGFHNNGDIETPFLDALAERAVQFANFTVHPVCAPTRASLLTGRHHLRTGVTHVHGGKDYLHPDEVTLADWFRANGYTTGMWGKWHSGKTTGYLPWERGFDEAYMADLYAHRDGGGLLNGKRMETTGWTTDALADMCIDFIRRHADRPFVAFVPFLAPHTPLVAPDALVRKYRDKGLNESLSTAYAMIGQVDSAIGRILGSLDDLDIRENTIVLFLSDNGPQYLGEERMSPTDYTRRYKSGMRGHKGSMWENGIKVPFLVSWPKRFPPAIVKRAADVHDILPTLIELCDLRKVPENILPMDGRSVMSYLEDGTDLPPKQSVIFSNIGWGPVKDAHYKWPDWQREEFRPIRPEVGAIQPFEDQLLTLRGERYKLLRHTDYSPGAPEAVDDEVLVDLGEDPLETENRATALPDRTSALRNELRDWFAKARKEPHAWHTPRFAIGPGTTNIIYLHAPAQQLGDIWTDGIWSRGWDQPGDGGEYLIRVTQAGSYALRTKVRGHSDNSFWLDLRIDGHAAGRIPVSSGDAFTGSLTLPVGDHLLQVTRAGNAGAETGAVEGLMFLELRQNPEG